MSVAVSSHAAVLTRYDAPVELWSIDVPDPGPRALIVEVLAATMCGTDAHMHAGAFASRSLSKLPLVMGHEVVGRIVSIGAEGRRDVLGRPLRVGDRVAWAYAWCGECYWCSIARQPTLCAFGRLYGWGPVETFPHLTGGYAEYVYVMPECKLVTVPEALGDEVAASATCALRTVVHGFERAGGVTPADTVVVQGSGAVGLYALAYALTCGARQVVVIGAPASRLATAEAWGAHAVVDLERTDRAERLARVQALTGGRGADLVIDCAGSSAALEEGIALVRRGGRYLVLGQADPEPAQIHGRAFNERQLTLVGSLSADASHYHRALQFAADTMDRFPFASLLGDEYTLATVTDAIASLAAQTELRPVIRPVPGGGVPTRTMTHTTGGAP